MDDSLSLKPPHYLLGKTKTPIIKSEDRNLNELLFLFNKTDNKSKLRLLGVAYGILADGNIRSRADLFCDDDALTH